MTLRKWTRSGSRETTSKAPSLTAGGVHQWSRSKGSPFLKKMENWPPSGPSQKRSSPPKAFMCGLFSPNARSSRLIQPKLSPSRPPGDYHQRRADAVFHGASFGPAGFHYYSPNDGQETSGEQHKGPSTRLMRDGSTGLDLGCEQFPLLLQRHVGSRSCSATLA